MFKSLLVILFSFLGLHPVHLSVTNIEYIENQKKFEISIRVFINDFEKIVDYQNNIKLNLATNKELPKADYYINKYITEHLKIKINGNYIPANKFSLKKKEKKDVTLWIYYEVKNNKRNIKDIEVFNNLMTDLYRDQKNMLILTIFGKQYAFTYNFKKNTNKITLK